MILRNYVIRASGAAGPVSGAAIAGHGRPMTMTRQRTFRMITCTTAREGTQVSVEEEGTSEGGSSGGWVSDDHDEATALPYDRLHARPREKSIDGGGVPLPSGTAGITDPMFPGYLSLVMVAVLVIVAVISRRVP